ncbi:MAG: flagellar protein FlgN, partial [Clostridiaceae bacterium]|nr:flagellar protein FlgN [Clostridiaceae bacterium]
MLDVVLIGKLADVLEKEASLYEKFLSVEKGKTDVIINGDVSELEGMVKIEQSFLEKMQELEAERERIIELIALKSGINASDLT